MNKDSNTKKPSFYYWIVALIILMLLNSFVFPALFSNNVEEVSYNTFLDELGKKNIDKVQVDETEIYFSLREKKEEDTELTHIFGNTETVYSTVRMEDVNLVDRLDNAGATFSKVAPKEINPLVSLFVAYVLPILIFVLI